MENQIVKVIQDNEIISSQAELIQQTFNQYFEAAKKWEAQVKTIVITDASQVEEMKKAREARLALKDIRCNAEKSKDKLKKDSLRYNKAVDGVNNVIKALTEPLEEYLEDQEKFVERQAELERVKVQKERESQLAPYVQSVAFYNLKEMSEAGYQELFSSSKTAYESRLAAEKKAAEDFQKAQDEMKAERERVNAENAKLKAEAEEREKAANEERKAQEKKFAEERKILEDKAKKEATEKAKIEAELKKKEKEERDRKEAEEKARKEAELAPDKEKLLTYALMLNNVQTPTLSTQEAKTILAQVLGKLAEITEILKII